MKRPDNDLIARISAAIDEEERIAKEASTRDSDWWWGPDAESAAERHIMTAYDVKAEG